MPVAGIPGGTCLLSQHSGGLRVQGQPGLHIQMREREKQKRKRERQRDRDERETERDRNREREREGMLTIRV
jgi:hypothetical protein